jgi:hypothetical protein
MAKTAIAGSSFVITSVVAMEDLKAIKRYRPSALTLTDPETRETTFRVDTGSNSLSSHGISFGGTSNCEGRFATVTLVIPEGTEDAKEYVLDTAGVALANLGKIEAGIAEALREVRAERETIAENITIIA